MLNVENSEITYLYYQHPLDAGKSAAVDIPNTRARRKSILISSPRENKHTRRKSVQISLSPVDCPPFQSRSWQPVPIEPQAGENQHRRRHDSRSRSKSVNQVQTNNRHITDQSSESLISDNMQQSKNHTEKQRRRRLSRSSSKSFHLDDREDDESPALHSLQEMITSLKQIPPKSHSELGQSPNRTSSPTSIEFLHTADPDSSTAIISQHVPPSPTSHDVIFANSKSWNSVDEHYRHSASMGTPQGSTNSFSQRMNSYNSYHRKGSYSSYSSRLV